MPKKYTRIRLVAGFRQDPLGELMRSPRSPSRNRGLLLRGRKWEGEEGGLLIREREEGERPTSKEEGRVRMKERGGGNGGKENSPSPQVKRVE